MYIVYVYGCTLCIYIVQQLLACVMSEVAVVLISGQVRGEFVVTYGGKLLAVAEFFKGEEMDLLYMYVTLNGLSYLDKLIYIYTSILISASLLPPDNSSPTMSDLYNWFYPVRNITSDSTTAIPTLVATIKE